MEVTVRAILGALRVTLVQRTIQGVYTIERQRNAGFSVRTSAAQAQRTA